MSRPLLAILIGVVVAGVATAIGVVMWPSADAEPSAPIELPEPAPQRPHLDLGERLDAPPRPRGLEQTDPLIRSAVEEAMERVRLSPDAAWAWHDLGEVCQANAYNDTALACYEQALIRDGSRAEAAYLLALLEQRRGNTDRALELIAYVESLAEFAPAHWRAGRWLLDAGEVDEAEDQFQRALAIDPDSDAAFFGMARVHLMRGEPGEAIGVLTTALAKTPNAAYRDQLLASAYRRAGDPAKAAAISAGAGRGTPVWRDRWLQEVDDQKTGYVGEMQRASRLIDDARYAEAIDLLERVRLQFPQRESLLINLALAESNLGNRDRAEQVLRSILEFDAESHLAWQNLGAMLVVKTSSTNSAPDEAFACLDRAIEIDPMDTRSRLLKGDYYALRQMTDEAIVHYREAIAVDPRLVQAYDKIGIIYAKQGRLEQAAGEFERIVAIDPKADPIWVRLATIYVRLERPDDAQRCLNEAMRRVPRTNPQIRQIQQLINQLVAGDG